MTAPRLLVTGARDWKDREAVSLALRRAWGDLGAHPQTVLVVGRATRGLDLLAEQVWCRQRLPVEAHPVDWNEPCQPSCSPKPGHRRRRKDGSTYCPSLGHRRNERMVAAGADLGVAFVLPCIDPRCDRTGDHPTHGTEHCMETAKAAGIVVRRVVGRR